MTNYKCILFDLDGTLTDSQAGIINSVQYALRKCGIGAEDRADLRKFIGPPLIDSFMEFYSFSKEKAVQATDFYREYFSVKGIFENDVYPQIPELLTLLRSSGKGIILATSKPTVFAEKILIHFDLMKYFSSVVGSNFDETRTSKDEVIEFVLSELNFDKKDIVMIGDRKHDIIGARVNGIDSVAVTYGYGSLEELENESPAFIVNSVQELTSLLLE